MKFFFRNEAAPVNKKSCRLNLNELKLGKNRSLHFEEWEIQIAVFNAILLLKNWRRLKFEIYVRLSLRNFFT